MQSQIRAAIYVRVSTSEQGLKGFGLDTQLNELKRFAAGNDYEVAERHIYQDVASGKDLNRPAYKQMMEQAKKGAFDVMIVSKIDRLSRNLQHLLTAFKALQEYKVGFISKQERMDFSGAIGGLVFNIFGAIAEFERDLIRDRTSQGKLTSARLGNFTGSAIPYGYRKVANKVGGGSKLALLAKEQKWVKQIYDWYCFEEVSMKEIAARLQKQGVPRGQHSPKRMRSTKWTRKTIQKILTDPVYKGDWYYNGLDKNHRPKEDAEIVRVPVPPCVSVLAFERAQQVRTSTKGGNKSDELHLLRGKIFNDSLEHPVAMYGVKRTKGGWSYKHTASRSAKQQHSSLEIPRAQMEDFVWQYIEQALTKPTKFLQFLAQQDPVDEDYLQQQKERADTLLQEAEVLQTDKVEEVEMRYLEGGIEAEIRDGLVEKLKEKAGGKEAEAMRIQQEIEARVQHTLAAEHLGTASEMFAERIRNCTRKQKYDLCQLLVNRVSVYREGKGKHRKIDVMVQLQFDVKSLSESHPLHRTIDPHTDKQKASSHPKKGNSGAAR